VCPLLFAVQDDDECPDELDIINCGTAGLRGGDYCEGDGECGTNQGRLCPELEVLDEDDCPDEVDIQNCATLGLQFGDLCEGDGECGTSQSLNNCDEADMYRVVGDTPAPTPKPTLSPTPAPTPSPTPSPTPKPVDTLRVGRRARRPASLRRARLRRRLRVEGVPRRVRHVRRRVRRRR